MNYNREFIRLRAALRELWRKQIAVPFVKERVSWPCGARPPACPTCSGELVGKHGKYGRFYGCKRFPLCYGSRNLDGSDGRTFVGVHNARASFMDDDPDGKYAGIYGDEIDPDNDCFPPFFLNGDY